MTVVVRESKETQNPLELTAGTGVAARQHGRAVPRPHAAALARYAGLDLDVQATGDLRHHLIEDVAITFGTRVAAFAPAGGARYGDRTIPMDDALVQVALDIGGRPYYAVRCPRRCTTTGCARSPTTRARRCTCACCAAGTAPRRRGGVQGAGPRAARRAVESGAVFSTKGAGATRHRARSDAARC